MGLQLVVVVIVALAWLAAVIDVARTDGGLVRRGSKGIWMTVAVLVPVLGGVAWLVAGRPTRSQKDLRRGMLLAEWEHDEQERKQELRDRIDRETGDRRREAQLRLIEGEVARREAKKSSSG